MGVVACDVVSSGDGVLVWHPAKRQGRTRVMTNKRGSNFCTGVSPFKKRKRVRRRAFIVTPKATRVNNALVVSSSTDGVWRTSLKKLMRPLYSVNKCKKVCLLCKKMISSVKDSLGLHRLEGRRR